MLHKYRVTYHTTDPEPVELLGPIWARTARGACRIALQNHIDVDSSVFSITATEEREPFAREGVD